jgi:Fuc2NAc and GlcNAc transferase
VIALAVAAAFVASWVLTGLARRYAVRRQLVDVPNDRSSHALPTPRGGGLGFVATFLVALVALYATGWMSANALLALFGASVVVAAVGFLDDHAHVSARVRFLVHALAAMWVFYWLGVRPGDALGVVWPMWVSAPLVVVFVVWLLNLYNFMDGIDGIAGAEVVTVGLSGAALGFVLWPESDLWLQPLLLAAAAGGFLVWNLPPARIFMGDVGSGFLGVCLAAFALESLAIAPAWFWAWMILLGAFVVDATFTLLRRMARGRAFYEAHRSHAYQHAAHRFGHRAVTLCTVLLNLLWLLPIAWFVASQRLAISSGMLLAYLPLFGIAIYFRAGTER